MMIDYAIRHQIDGILLSSPDQKWISTKVDRLKKHFRAINKEVDIIVSDSGQEARTENRYLPGGTVNIIMGRLVGIRKLGQDRKDYLGRWSSFRLEGNRKVVQVITVY